MQLCDGTLRALAGIVTGDDQRSAYRTGTKVQRFLERFGPIEPYPGGTCSRVRYAEEVLATFQGTPALGKALVAAVDPTEFLHTGFSAADAVKHLQEYLVFDGLSLLPDGRGWVIRATGANPVVLAGLGTPANPLTHDFIREQLAKCERKLGDGDNDGAITNARALLEAVLREIGQRVSGAPSDTKGDLVRQYKGVQKLLNLQPERDDLHESLRQMLTGLVSIVNGIAAARNAMSDAHARTYKPAPHHARLVVNAANTITDFLLASYEAQRDRGVLQPSGRT